MDNFPPFRVMYGGTDVSGLNPFPVSDSTLAGLLGGTIGNDHSANKPALPNIGAAFANSGPYASYVLVATIPANSARHNGDVENNSGAQIAIILDDGTAGNGAQPVNASVLALAGGSSAGAQGGSWQCNGFTGRVQIYAPSSTSQIMARDW